MCHVQTDMVLACCDYRAGEHGKSESDVPCPNRHGTYILWLQSRRAWKVKKWCAIFKQIWLLHAVITKQENMESQRVMCHIQTAMAVTYCDYKARVRKWCAMFKQTWHLHTVITRQESMENQKVMCHVQTDMALTRCDYKAGDHEKSESDVPHSNRHGTYILWLQSKKAWKVRKWCAMFKQKWHLLPVITKQESMESQKMMYHVQTNMALTYCDYKVRQHGKSESDVPWSNRHGTYPLWLQGKRAWNVRKWCTIQTDMALTYCDYKAREHGKSESDVLCSNRHALTPCDYKAREDGKSESDVSCSNRHGTYFLWLQSGRTWKVRKWCALFIQTQCLHSRPQCMESQKIMHMTSSKFRHLHSSVIEQPCWLRWIYSSKLKYNLTSCHCT